MVPCPLQTTDPASRKISEQIPVATWRGPWCACFRYHSPGPRSPLPGGQGAALEQLLSGMRKGWGGAGIAPGLGSLGVSQCGCRVLTAEPPPLS